MHSGSGAEGGIHVSIVITVLICHVHCMKMDGEIRGDSRFIGSLRVQFQSPGAFHSAWFTHSPKKQKQGKVILQKHVLCVLF